MINTPSHLLLSWLSAMKSNALPMHFRSMSHEEKLLALSGSMGPCRELIELGYGRCSFSKFLENGDEIQAHLYHTQKRIWEIHQLFHWGFQDRLKWLNLWIPEFDHRPFGRQYAAHVLKADEPWWPSDAWGLSWAWEIFWPQHQEEASECIITWWVNEEERAYQCANFLQKTWQPLDHTEEKDKKRL